MRPIQLTLSLIVTLVTATGAAAQTRPAGRPATYDVRHAAAFNDIYALPFGHGRRFLGSLDSVADGIVSGWTLNSVVSVQSGFPFTPQLAYNPANNGDSRNPVRPFLNPAFTGSVVTGNPNQWFNPNAFIAPPSNSGFYGTSTTSRQVQLGLKLLW